MSYIKKPDGYYLYDGVWYLKDGKFSPTGEGTPFQEKTSTNYTRLNGVRFEEKHKYRAATPRPVKVEDGDTITIGKSIKFSIYFK